MINYTLELAVKGNITKREIVADGVLQDNMNFVVFYQDIEDGEPNQKKSIVSYNPAFIVSLVGREDD